MNREDLKRYDFVVMIDKSGSMSTSDCKNGKSRWEAAKDQTKAIAAICEQFDDDGIDVVVFDSTPKEYHGVTSAKVAEIFSKNQPGGSTDTAAALKLALDGYFQRKSKGSKGFLGGLFGKKEDPFSKSATKPMIIVCITDGEPNSRDEVVRVIVSAANKIDSEEELGISFIQIGSDKGARNFLKFLDEELGSKGARFDIVNSKNDLEMDNISIEQVLIDAITK